MDEFNHKVLKTKKISEKGHFKVSLVSLNKQKKAILTEAVGNPPQGDTIEMQSSFKEGELWKHTVWVREDMHNDFFQAYLDMVKEASWELPNHELIEQLAKSVDLGEQKIDISEILNAPEQTRQIMASIGQIRDSQTKNYRDDLARFKQLLDNKSGETELHKFLKSRPWVFGIDYIHEAAKDKFAVEFGEFDFLLERFNKVYDIVELKGANQQPFDIYRASDSKQGERIRYKMSEHLSGAILQVLDYFKEFEKSRSNEDIRGKRGLKNYRNPRGQIVIGVRADLNSQQEDLINEINEKFNNIDVLTYTDLYDRAEYFVGILENSILSSND